MELKNGRRALRKQARYKFCTISFESQLQYLVVVQIPECTLLAFGLHKPVFTCFNQTSWTLLERNFLSVILSIQSRVYSSTSGCMFSWCKTPGCSDPLYKLTACSGKLECLTSSFFFCSLPALMRTNHNYLFILTHLKNLVKKTTVCGSPIIVPYTL